MRIMAKLAAVITLGLVLCLAELSFGKLDRVVVSSGTKYEKIAGYSRAVRVGNIIEVAGTAALDEKDEIVGHEDMEAQTRFIFDKIGKALVEAGGSFKHVTRTRMFVTDISKWEGVVRVHGEVFKGILPVATLIQVSKLVQPGLLIEIEVSAVVDE